MWNTCAEENAGMQTALLPWDLTLSLSACKSSSLIGGNMMVLASPWLQRQLKSCGPTGGEVSVIGSLSKSRLRGAWGHLRGKNEKKWWWSCNTSPDRSWRCYNAVSAGQGWAPSLPQKEDIITSVKWHWETLNTSRTGSESAWKTVETPSFKTEPVSFMGDTKQEQQQQRRRQRGGE